MQEEMCQKFKMLLKGLFKKVTRSTLITKLEAIWVFLIFFYLPIFLFSGLSKNPEVDNKVAMQKEKVIEHRKDWDKYLNPKRVTASGKMEVEKFSEEVLEPIALGIEQSYVEGLDLPVEKKVEAESDF